MPTCPPLTVQETMHALGKSDANVRRMLKEGVRWEIQPRRRARLKM